MEEITAIKTAEGFNIFKFIWKHWLLILTIVLLMPTLVSVTNETVKSKNYLYPVYTVGSLIIGADNILNANINTLRDDPDKLVGMKNPDTGIWKHTVYFWLFFINVIWTILLDLHLILLPFIGVYWICNNNNSSTKGKNMMYTLLIVLGFMFVVNSIFTILYLINGTISITIPSDFSPLQKFIFVGTNLLPFHGVGNLITYIIQLFIH